MFTMLCVVSPFRCDSSIARGVATAGVVHQVYVHGLVWKHNMGTRKSLKEIQSLLSPWLLHCQDKCGFNICRCKLCCRAMLKLLLSTKHTLSSLCHSTYTTHLSFNSKVFQLLTAGRYIFSFTDLLKSYTCRPKTNLESSVHDF